MAENKTTKPVVPPKPNYIKAKVGKNDTQISPLKTTDIRKRPPVAKKPEKYFNIDINKTHGSQLQPPPPPPPLPNQQMEDKASSPNDALMAAIRGHGGLKGLKNVSVEKQTKKNPSEELMSELGKKLAMRRQKSGNKEVAASSIFLADKEKFELASKQEEERQARSNIIEAEKVAKALKAEREIKERQSQNKKPEVPKVIIIEGIPPAPPAPPPSLLDSPVGLVINKSNKKPSEKAPPLITKEQLMNISLNPTKPPSASKPPTEVRQFDFRGVLKPRSSSPSKGRG